MNASCIYEGTIRHRRFEPQGEFNHRLSLAYIDLEELPRLLGGRLIAQRPGLVRFRRRDYLGDAAVPLDRAVRDFVNDRTGARPSRADPPTDPAALVRALLQPGQLLLLHGAERRAPSGAGRGGDEHAMEGAARVRTGERARKPRCARRSVREGATCVAVHGHGSSLPRPCGDARRHAVGPHLLSRAGTTVFDATLALRRRELTRASMAATTARYPLATVRVLMLIYARALGLKLAGVPVHRHPQQGLA